jgi:4'-phosphopantetheinyl transferase
VHLWCLPLEIGSDSLRGLRRVLCDEEHQRADRFRFEPDRRRYIAARAALRILLGRYIDQPAERIVFSYSTTGKPSLQRADGGSGPHFNVSHSGEIALLAFCADAELGIDVELVHDIEDTESIVRRFFCAEEVDQWLELPAHLGQKAFYDCWTRKEAVVKAMGGGLSVPLDAFQVSFSPTDAPRVRFRHDGDVTPWSLYDVSPASDYSGALAIRGAGWDLRCWLASWT